MFAFRFVAIGPFLTEIKQVPYLTLKIQGQGHDENQLKSNQVIYRSGSLILPKMTEIQKVVWKLSHEQKSTAGGGGVWTGTKTWSYTRYIAWFKNYHHWQRPLMKKISFYHSKLLCHRYHHGMGYYSKKRCGLSLVENKKWVSWYCLHSRSSISNVCHQNSKLSKKQF